LKKPTFLIFLTTFSLANAAPEQTAGAPRLGAQDMNFYLEVSSYDYEEESLMSKSASVPFINFGLDKRVGGSLDGVSLSVTGGFGRTDYSGSGYTSNDLAYIVKADVKKTIYDGTFEVFAGAGIRYLKDNWGGKQTSSGQYTYDRTSDYRFVIIGADMAVLDSEAKLAVSYKHLLQGNQHLDLEGIGTYQDAKMRQNTGYGVDVELYLNKRFAVFLEYWNIAASDLDSANGLFIEPQNTTLQAGFRYHF